MLGPRPAGSTLVAYSSGFSAGKVGILNVRIEDDDGNVILAPTTADIIEIDAGGTYSVYRYLGVFPTETHWVMIWEDTSEGGIEAAMPGESGAAPLAITPGIASPGPCQVWATVEDMLACCDTEVGTDTSVLDQALISASEILYLLSGAEFSGECMSTVRPTGRDCCWTPQRLSDTCVPLSRVRLAGYPVTFIVEVLIDGETISPSEYRLDGNRYLTRLVDADGRAQRWPAIQRLDKNADEDTFFVTYMYGTDPPAAAVGATAQLACAITRACPGSSGVVGDCELPAGTVRVARQGITIDSQSLGLWLLGQMRTGMPLVDAFLAVYGKTQRKRTVIMVPETDPWPMRVS